MWNKQGVFAPKDGMHQHILPAFPYNAQCHSVIVFYVSDALTLAIIAVLEHLISAQPSDILSLLFLASVLDNCQDCIFLVRSKVFENFHFFSRFFTLHASQVTA